MKKRTLNSILRDDDGNRELKKPATAPVRRRKSTRIWKPKGNAPVLKVDLVSSPSSANGPADPSRPPSPSLSQAPLIELANPPSDGISNLRFSNHSDNLLVWSWDKTVRLYDASANLLKGEFKHGGAVLDCCFHDDSSGFSAAADNKVRRPGNYWKLGQNPQMLGS